MKGFRCAYAVLHGGPGCSGFAKQAIRKRGLWAALALIRQSFRNCRGALSTLNTLPEYEKLRRNREHKEQRSACLWHASSCIPVPCHFGCCG